MNRRRILGIGILLVALGLPATAFAAQPASPFTGSWESVDFDGSHQTLVVSSGATPSVTYQDFFASGCDNAGVPTTHWVAAGKGSVEGDVLGIQYGKSGCGRFLQGGYEDWYLYDADTDTLIDTADIVWTRTR